LQKIQSALISQVMSAYYTVKNCFTGVTITRSQARDLTHRKLTVCSPSYHGENWSC